MQLKAEIYAWHQNLCEDGARPPEENGDVCLKPNPVTQRAVTPLPLGKRSPTASTHKVMSY